ncbi:caspase family protein [Rhizobium sp. TRM95796]|uniref:caspase family protein n=1 Tax=Rhizobium sp. TRM95796 TaxID=2979862 RepID=UPI0021E89E43|nr:caspase family protein [Rhizobium sp. TRM95796]MCV3765550.1 caspase family protein [Rhizobium sp. TRM95796]
MAGFRARGWWFFGLCLAVFLLATEGSAEAARRVALLIGNQNYERTTPLRNPANDVELMRNTLTEAGFDDVMVAKDVDLAGMRKALRTFENKAEGAEVAVLYYSGHGMEMNGENYLIPIDAVLASDKDVEDEALSLSRAERSLNGATRLKLMILDACRNNPFLDTMTRSAGTRAVSRGLARVEPQSVDTLVAYASRAGTVALDGEGGNSPFAEALARYITQPGVDIRIALGQVRDAVMKATNRQQEPFVYGSLGGAQIFLSIKQIDITINTGPAQDKQTIETASAAADWQNIKDLADKDLLEAFISKHGGDPVYRMLAEKKIKQLQATQAKTEAAADQIAWEALKGSTDPAALKRFIERYPQSPFRREAEASLAALSPPPVASSTDTLSASERDCQLLAGELQGARGFAGVYLDRIDAKRALTACAQAVNEKPSAGLYVNLLGRAYEADKNYVEAAKRYREAADLGDMFGLANLGWLQVNGSVDGADPAKGVEAFETAARAGNHFAQASLGQIYRDGLAGQAQDYAKSFDWYRQAADKGNANALGNLGWFYREGVTVSQDYARSVDYYRRGAEAGDMASIAGLGYAAQNGLGMARNYEEARQWYEKGANAGDAYSMASLGFLYDTGAGVKQDYVEARYWYEKAANEGSAYAMGNLARLYDQGLGTAVDPDEAVRWAIAAVSRGDSAKIGELKTSPDNFSPLFRKGFQEALKEQGVFAGEANGEFGVDTSKAIDDLAAGKTGADMLDSSAEETAPDVNEEQEQSAVGASGRLGNLMQSARTETEANMSAKASTEDGEAAQTLSAQCYELAGEPGSKPNFGGVDFSDIDVRAATEACSRAAAESPDDPMLLNMLGRAHDAGEDYAAAREAYDKAAGMGNGFASVNRAWLSIYGKGEDADVDKGFGMLKAAAAKGNPAAQASLGWLYREGYGSVARNYRTAVEWYRKAAAQDNPNALAAMGWLYREGLGVARDDKESLRAYRRAAELGEINAIGSLGYALQNGVGTDVDIVEAKLWYEAGAERGDAYCMGSLAWLYEAGEGVEQDYKLAAQWYEKAGEAGSSYAQGNLARLYDQGLGVEEDAVKAVELAVASIAAGETDFISDVKDGAKDFSAAFRRGLQKELKSRGYYSGPLDGVFGATTARAIDKLAGRDS